MRSPRKNGAAPRGEGIAPTQERWRRGDIEALAHAIPDEAGRPSRPYRKVDTLAFMQRRGTITAAMRQAGEDFHALFQRASLDPLSVPDLARMRQGWRDGAVGEAQAAARERVLRALAAVGGIASPGGSCLWHVVGCEWTVKDWALRAGWGGRPLSQEQAAGVLVAALGVLAALFGV